MPAYGKLVPDLIRAQGLNPVTYVADTVEYADRLHDKLREEVCEFLDSGDPEELADILAVVDALATLTGVDVGQLRAAKAEERGEFAGRIVWCGNRPGATVVETPAQAHPELRCSECGHRVIDQPCGPVHAIARQGIAAIRTMTKALFGGGPHA
jgi:predicted house-cleaning noncanonical NTP pyrophosphatase (MazG superfamily)/DNA-directed RNA polymerase subunit RPC12/RpoP